MAKLSSSQFRHRHSKIYGVRFFQIQKLRRDKRWNEIFAAARPQFTNAKNILNIGVPPQFFKHRLRSERGVGILFTPCAAQKNF